jgi:hypothetical protein
MAPPMNATTQLMISVLTVLTSGVMAGVVTHWLATTRQEKQFRREKLEQLYLAVHGFCTAFVSSNIVWLPVMTGEMHYNEALDLQIKNAPAKGSGFYETAEMLVNIYFPPLRAALNEIIKARDATNKVQGEFGRTYKAHGPDETHRMFLDPFKEGMNKFSLAHRCFNQELFLLAKSI